MFKRHHYKYECDRFWKRGELIFHRESFNSGLWSRSGEKIVTSSLSAREDFNESIPLRVLEEIFTQHFFLLLDTIRLREFRETKIIETELRLINLLPRKFIYLEVSFAGISQSYFEEYNSFKLGVKNFLTKFMHWVSTPIWEGDIVFESLELSPSVFGYVLHESLGHRLEEDCFVPAAHNRCIKANFDVFDTPGIPEYAGYTPFGDDGTEGTSVCLFNGKTGERNLLTAETGNLRAIDHLWHPIIRQRCLVVKPNCNSFGFHCKKNKDTVLKIDDLTLASIEDDTVNLWISIAYIYSNQGLKKRLPPLTLSFAAESFHLFTPIGNSKYHNPPGGCHKNNQRELWISTVSPAAIISGKALENIDICIDIKSNTIFNKTE